MALPIEDYALIGDTQTGALVGRDGSIDWLCFPRFDSAACFAALLGTPENGRWLLAPVEAPRRVRRRYRAGTLVLETEMVTSTGTVRIVDCMPPRRREPDVVRVVEGVDGTVDMRMDLAIRFDYGSVVPWVRQLDGRLEAVAGPEALSLTTPIPTRGEGYRTVAEFSVSAGDRVPFSLAWHPSVEPPPPPVDALQAADDTDAWWTDWSQSCTHRGPWRDDIVRSLVTLKGLTYAPTGGIVAAVTTSLPEHIGGVRNWDYRYCWLRDATFVLYAFLLAGYNQEASAWRDWLLRAVAGRPDQIQIMYGPAGERRLPEMELPWLPGYEGSLPVRVGNAAATQLQLDVFGEVLDALHQARGAGIDPDPWSWNLQRALVEFLESNWQQPDEGIWEIRGPRRDFTHSKVMAWVAFDRAVRAVERYGLPGPVDRWRSRREEVHREVCERAWDERRQRFTQFYGSGDLDASLLLLPIVGFLRPDDPRLLATLEAIERELCVDGLVYRYPSEGVTIDGLPPGEGVFLACSFWLADNFALVGRRDDALALFERVRGLANDVGLLSEEYDVTRKRLVGNFPQAFSHVGLVNTAINLSHGHGAAQHRQEG